MTDYEKRLVEEIANKYDEDENSYPYYDRRVYLDLNGVISSQGEETDILFAIYTINEECDREYIFSCSSLHLTIRAKISSTLPTLLTRKER